MRIKRTDDKYLVHSNTPPTEQTRMTYCQTGCNRKSRCFTMNTCGDIYNEIPEMLQCVVTFHQNEVVINVNFYPLFKSVIIFQ